MTRKVLSKEALQEYTQRILVNRKACKSRNRVVCVDENLNDQRISDMGINLINRNLIDGLDPVWIELRECSNGERKTAIGGFSSDFLRLFEQEPGDRIDGKVWNWRDGDVAQYVVTHFYSCNQVVLLTADLKNKRNDDLRLYLENAVRPALQGNPCRNIKLTVLYKKRKTLVEDYCVGVTAYIEHMLAIPSYEQRFI